MAEWNPYEELEISQSASREVIQAAYRRLARKYHPDSGESPDPERMTRLNRAYEDVRRRVERASARRVKEARSIREVAAAAEAGNWPLVGRLARELLEQQPNHVEAMLLAGEAALETGTPDEAPQWADRALRIGPTTEGVLFFAAYEAEQAQDWFRARGLAAALLVESPDDQDAAEIYSAAVRALLDSPP